jgi:hypothetical protein
VIPNTPTNDYSLPGRVGKCMGEGAAQGCKCVRKSLSFAPLGLGRVSLLPTAGAVGCVLSPAYAAGESQIFHRVVEILVLMHTLQVLITESVRG